MQTAQIIVPEKFRAGREAVRRRMLHSRAEQDAFFTLFRRGWAHHLSPVQERIVRFFMDATFGQRRDVVDLTWSQIEAGERGSNGHEWMRPPIAMSRSQFYDHVVALTDMGVLGRRDRGGRRGTDWWINLDWKPTETSKTLAEVRREMAERGGQDGSGNPDTTGPETRTPLNRYKIQPVEKGRTEYPPTSRSDDDAPSERSENFTPQSEAVGRAIENLSSAPANCYFQQPNDPFWNSASLEDLARTWRHAWAESYPGVPCPAFGTKEGAMLAAMLKKRFPQDVPARHAFVDFVVRNWSPLMAGCFGWMKRRPPPEMPSVVFLCTEKFAHDFTDAFAGRKRFETINLLPVEKRELERMVAAGMNREDAIAAIGERRGMSRAHEELAQARRISGDNTRKEEERRRWETEERRARDRKAFLAAKREAVPSPADTYHFAELDALEPIQVELAPVDLSKWN